MSQRLCYRISPKSSGGVTLQFEVFSYSSEGDLRRWVVKEHWATGCAYRDLEPALTRQECAGSVECGPYDGAGFEVGGELKVEFEFDNSFSSSERKSLAAHWSAEDEDGLKGMAWLFEADHDWAVEDHKVFVHGPVQIDLFDVEKETIVERDVVVGGV